VPNVEVTRSAIVVPKGLTTEPVEVRFDGRTVWSFNLERDARAGPTGARIPWPQALRPLLEGTTTLALVAHTSATTLFEREITFTDADQRVSVVDPHGHPLAVDKGGRLQRDFHATDQTTRDLIVENVDLVLHELRERADLDAFLAFGCLLGAVRDGRMIGHDADADVAYLSRYHHPLDIIRENRRAVRTMRALGHQVVPMSAADFKIWLPLPDGRRCGIDVFGGYLLDGEFYLLPTLHGHLDPSALLPQRDVVLEGRSVAGPARPEELLELTYGHQWRVPDPSFKYEHPRWLGRHMDGYWRGPRNNLRDWDAFYKSGAAARVPREPSRFAVWAHEYVGDDLDLVDVGTGTGRDAIWFARQGHRVLALDFSPQALKLVRRRARQARLSVEVSRLNVNDVRSTLPTGARLAFERRPRHVYARLLLDGVRDNGRLELLRFAQMVSRQGGKTLLEFREGRRCDLDTVAAEVTGRGGVVEHKERGRDLAPYADENPVVSRLVVRWRP
jgi:hypothetical protein